MDNFTGWGSADRLSGDAGEAIGERAVAAWKCGARGPGARYPPAWADAGVGSRGLAFRRRPAELAVVKQGVPDE
jgi:hypothetical protein